MRYAIYLVLLLATCEAAALSGNSDVWSAYDTDRNGFLEPTEFAAFCAAQPRLGKEEIRFERFDTNGDGRLSQKEFGKALGSLFKSGVKR